MNPRLIDKITRYAVVCVVLMLLAPQINAAEMENYCIVPPYVSKDVAPNIMIMMDNSADMMNSAYTDVYTPTATKDNYVGYFKPTGCYSYSSKFEEQLNTSVSPNRTYLATEACPSTAPFRGNLMNWATMSRYDVLQKVIIGGNTVSKQGNAHTLLAIDGSWTKSYGGCDFVVTNGNLTITDSSGLTCNLIASPASPIASIKNPDGVISFVDVAANKIFASVRWIWDHVSIVSVAEAGDCTVTVGTLNGTVGQAYSLVMNATSGTTGSTDYVWSNISVAPSSFFTSATPVLSGTKKPTATWSGTPTAAGTYNFSVTLTRGANSNCGPTAISGSIIIACPTAVQIQTTSLNNGTTGSAYSYTMTGLYGIAPYAWSASGFPSGISIDSATGTISGTPTQCGTYSPTITLTDASGSCQTTTSSNFTMTVSTTLAINTSTLSDGVNGSVYLFTMSGSGGVAPYTWSAAGLPPGLSMSAVGVISGSPSGGPGSYTVDVTLQDGNNCTVQKSLSLLITTGAVAFQIITSSLPGGVKDAPYSYTVTGAGGALPLTWSASGLPSGLSIDAITGLISGTTTQTGTFDVYITVIDSTSTTSSDSPKHFTLTITRMVNSQTFNIKVVLVEEALTDLNGNDIYDPGSGETYTDSNGNGVWDGKQGVFQKYWDTINPKARWGLTSYAKQGYVELPSSGCIPASPASSFYTQIQNVQPSTTFPLAAGLYGDINYYGFSSANFPPYASASYQGCGSSDPIDSTPCRRNFVLIISSGADLTGTAFTTKPDGTAFSSASCTTIHGNVNAPLVKNACYGFTNDMRSDKTGKQVVLTYAVNTMGTDAAGEILEDAAAAGGGKYYEAQEISRLEKQLDQAFKDMLGRAASGTAASVLASGEGSGANLIQAVYYPTKKFGADEIGWIGRLTNLWYFVDPKLNSSSIREDSGADNGDGTFGAGDKVLTLKTDATHNDNIVQLFFDSTAEATKAHRWKDANGDAIIDTQLPDVTFESVGYLWEAGSLLWSRDLTSSPRTIYTSTGSGLTSLTTANKTTLRPYLQAASDAESEAIIRYMNGEDTPFSPAIAGFAPDYRPRSVSVNGDGPYTWKLADVLNSTPKISSWLPLNSYHKLHNDSTYGTPGSDPSLQDPADSTHYITSSNYRGRGMIFAGANDGMLHAFKLGTLELKWTGMGDYDKARLTGTGLGQEAWAFIPKNALPYLKYTADLSYCHVYTVDLTPYIFDASIATPAGCTEMDSSNCVRTVNSWRTIVIGGMRYGGACKKTCTDTDCVSTPTTDPADATKGLGYSSYFALDITDQNNPVLLWEFSSEQLGFTTTGPAILRESVKDATNNPLPNRNGKWFVVFGSGPTGPIDAASQQFLAHSGQNLSLFVLDLKTGTLLRTIDTGVTNAFAGSLLNSTMDTDIDYQDDVLYIPYVQKAADSTWTDGGILRLSTGEDTNPVNWNVSAVMSGIGPMTSSISKLQNRSTNTLWLFFGAGRYYFEQSATADDPSNQRKIFGIKEPCLSVASGLFDTTCTTSRSLLELTDVTNILNVPTNPGSASFKGWYINLDRDGFNGSVADPTVRAERVVTDPVAATSGVVFFTTFKPYVDTCSLGGKSSIWAVMYNSGGDASALLKGQALIQVSTGSIEQLKLSEAFKDSVTGLDTGNRKSAAMEGVPPVQQGLSILSTPPPVKKVVHIKER